MYANRFRWVNKPRSPTLNWGSLMPMVKRAACDVLLLLDCCYAGSAARGDINGTNELIAACGREVIAVGVTDRSFTQNLMRKLRSFQDQPFTVSQLYERLLKDRKRLITTPQYAPLSGRDRPSICMAPFKPADSTPEEFLSSLMVQPTSLTASLSPERSSPRSVSTPTSPLSRLSPLPEGPRVLLALSLRATATVPDLERWIQWLSTDAPHDIQNVDVKIEAAYKGNSTLALISMPVNTWSRLPDTSAYRFIDFITSPNLLMNLPAKAVVGSDNIAKVHATDALPYPSPSKFIGNMPQPTEQAKPENSFLNKTLRAYLQEPTRHPRIPSPDSSDTFYNDKGLYEYDASIASETSPSHYTIVPAPIPWARRSSNGAAFCKGAIRLQINKKEKAMKPFTTADTWGDYCYWKCIKCSFHGDMVISPNGQNSVDTRVASFSAINYRWQFLFKSHVKIMVPIPSPPAFSIFQCVFCYAERIEKIFVGVDSYLTHLQEHRDRPLEAGRVGGIHYIIGRAADPDEDYDVILLPSGYTYSTYIQSLQVQYFVSDHRSQCIKCQACLKADAASVVPPRLLSRVRS